MAVELAPDKIRVNVINPVAGETPLLAEFMGGADTPEMRAKFIATIPLGRLSPARSTSPTPPLPGLRRSRVHHRRLHRGGRRPLRCFVNPLAVCS